jgi:hypothetical protein
MYQDVLCGGPFVLVGSESLLSVDHSSVVIIVMVAQSLYCGIPVVCFRSLKMNNRKANNRIKVGVWGIEDLCSSSRQVVLPRVDNSVNADEWKEVETTRYILKST